MLRNLKVSVRFIIGFGLLILLQIATSVLLINRMEYLASSTTELYEHPFTVSKAVLNARIGIGAIHRTMGDILIANDNEEIRHHEAEIEKHEEEIYENLATVQEKFLGEKRLIQKVLELIHAWRPLRTEVINLMEKGKREEAVSLYKKDTENHVGEIFQSMQVIKDFSENKAEAFMELANEEHQETLVIVILFVLSFLLLGIMLSILLSRSVTVPLTTLEAATRRVAKGDLDAPVAIDSKDEFGKLALDFMKMTASLREAKKMSQLQDWLKNKQMEFDDLMRGKEDLKVISRTIIDFLARAIEAQVGTIYLPDEKDASLRLAASYALKKGKGFPERITKGEGIIGQAALDRKVTILSNLPDEYFVVSSSLGETLPRNVIIVPCLFNDDLSAVIELGTLKEVTTLQMELIERLSTVIAIDLHSAIAAMKVKRLLEETQAQAEELQAQQEELQTQNEELETQSEELRSSEEELKSQREELQVTNEELEEKNRFLDRQRKEIAEKNKALEIFNREVEEKARELELSGKYKSEFLANMSHELRTPLNSLLLLARDLMGNKHGNLTQDDVESAEIIHKSGNDLLLLINEILDLSRIEAGRMTINVIDVELEDVKASLVAHFKHMAQEKNLNFDVEVESGLPKTIATDPQRLEQIMKNLISNALKFTEKGGVSVSLRKVSDGDDLPKSGLKNEEAFALSVTDTGIGIPEDQQAKVFDAFHQLDGGTARKYEGTGLGLSISRELAKLLGGELQLKSTVGEGSTFTLYLPLRHVVQEDHGATEKRQPTREMERKTEVVRPAAPEPKPAIPYISDDRENLKKGEKKILVIEDDPNFAKILQRQCHERGFKCIVSGNGVDGLKLATETLPEAIILDNRLPGMNGLEVLESLKQNPLTRHIPVHMMSVDEASNDAFRRGALGYLSKPVRQEDMDAAFQRLEDIVQRRVKDLLVVEDNPEQRIAVRKLIGNGDVFITEASTGKEALELLEKKKFDCMVLDLGLPDMHGIELLKQLNSKKDFSTPPVIVYTGKELSREENLALQEYSNTIIVKGVKSEERLLDETALFLHRVVGKLPAYKQSMIMNLYDRDLMFQNKRVLIVDDDMRNSFALSKILRDKGMIVSKAESGQKALDLLQEGQDFDLVLMDIMMPEMDGYETTRRIRAVKRLSRLPIIALTAKAMKDDRDKCIDAGASDYLPKPVDLDRLFSMLRVWLYQ